MKRGGYHVTIQTKYFPKDLVFSEEDKAKIDASSFVVLYITKGGLGFEIIKNNRLVR